MGIEGNACIVCGNVIQTDGRQKAGSHDSHHSNVASLNRTLHPVCRRILDDEFCAAGNEDARMRLDDAIIDMPPDCALSTSRPSIEVLDWLRTQPELKICGPTDILTSKFDHTLPSELRDRILQSVPSLCVAGIYMIISFWDPSLEVLRDLLNIHLSVDATTLSHKELLISIKICALGTGFYNSIASWVKIVTSLRGKVSTPQTRLCGTLCSVPVDLAYIVQPTLCHERLTICHCKPPTKCVTIHYAHLPCGIYVTGVAFDGAWTGHQGQWTHEWRHLEQGIWFVWNWLGILDVENSAYVNEESPSLWNVSDSVSRQFLSWPLGEFALIYDSVKLVGVASKRVTGY